MVSANHDAAWLRLLFAAVAEDQALWQRNPMAAWTKLYEGVRDSDGGLMVLQELEYQREEIERLQHEVDRLNGLVPRPERLPMKGGG